jgi:hypothetical protein
MADSVKSLIVGWAEWSDRLVSDLTTKPIAARVAANDPGCVKTRRRSIAIEQITRSRPFHVPTSEAHSILKSKSRISFSARFELSSFHTAWTRFGPPRTLTE